MTTDADSSRQMLPAISSSIVTVAGVVFSITIVRLSLAASQYSSRVLRAFTRDKANQAVLGGMAGTFAYSVTVMLTITGGEGSFVPSIAVFSGDLMAIAAIAIKALSPGVNDTTTAVVCVDHLTAILVHAAGRSELQNIYGKDGRLRVIVRTPTFDGLLGKGFNHIRQNASGNIAVITALLNAIEVLAGSIDEGPRRKALSGQLEALAELVERTVQSPYDRRAVEEHLERVVRQADFKDVHFRAHPR